MKSATVLAFLVAASASGSWLQFGGDPAHTGIADVTGQPLQSVLAQVVFDPFVQLEVAFEGELLIHYAVPLIDGDDVFMEVKSGTYTFGQWQTQTWGVRALRWNGSKLTTRWTTNTDWKPVPPGGGSFEPVFQPILANGSIYMPAAGGTILRVDRETGQVLARLGAGSIADSGTYVSGPLAADASGNVYYNVIAFSAIPWTTDIRDAWLTRVTLSGAATSVRYASMVPIAPAPAAQCLGAFDTSDLPWPPSPSAVPPSSTCGSQRSGVNVTPAIAPDGTVYTVSRAHLNSRWSYLVALNPDLTPKWSASLRGRFSDGCNVLLPPNGTAGGCRQGAVTGVDPSDNTIGAGRVVDDSSSSPMVAPDGSVFYGAFTRYNFEQGHLMHFTASGDYLGAYRFGWDITPAVYAHDGSYSIVTKENHYSFVGSYCDDLGVCSTVRRPDDPQGYFITQLDPALRVQWMFLNTNGDEWCVNAPAVDRNKVTYVNAEDGYVYALDSSGLLRQQLFLQPSGGAAYTSMAIDGKGRIYAESGGILFVIGVLPRQRAVRH